MFCLLYSNPLPPHMCANISVGRKIAHLGDLHLKDDTDGADPIDIPIDKVIQHYNYEFGLLGHNIALIRLRSPAPVSSNIYLTSSLPTFAKWIGA